MRAIPTYYGQDHFQSRLEAKWAVFFDAIEVKWVYEPEGFVLDNGDWYCPDFLLNDWLYVEVKPHDKAPGINKVYEFAKQKPIALLVGNISTSFLWIYYEPYEPKPSEGAIDWVGVLKATECCKRIALCLDTPGSPYLHQFDIFYRWLSPYDCPKCEWRDKKFKTILKRSKLVENAYRFARQSRWGHGQSPVKIW